MPGLIITGALGSGKSFAQRILVRQHGFWAPLTVTTRTLELHETDAISVSEAQFSASVSAGAYVLPTRFGDHWYAWTGDDLARITSHSPGKVALNVRPYTALVLAAFLPMFFPVWLWVEEDERTRQLRARGYSRDMPTTGNRLREDEDDSVYAGLFPLRVKSDERVIDSLLGLLERRT